MARPRLLDLYCGAGGCSVGYHRAGFDVVGVDINPQPNYPFEFVQADALEYLENVGGAYPNVWAGFNAIHASPPCQAYSAGTAHLRAAGTTYPDLLAPTRALLERTGLPWVIENVPGAPMRADYVLCGSMFALPGLRRHRLFETSWHGFDFALACDHSRPAVTVVGNGPHGRSHFYLRERDSFDGFENFNQRWVQMTKDAMGIDWMNRNELAESIPPAYTEYIGAQLLARIKQEAVA